MSEMVKIDRPIPNTNEIQLWLHCKLCLNEIPNGISPHDYQQIEAGWTELGLQVWCKRHNANIVHIDFQGLKLPANTTRVPNEFD